MTRLSVCAAVLCRGGKVLLATRRPGAALAGLWEFPGGKVEAGEEYGACITRELEEELGLPVYNAALRWELSHEYPGRVVDLHYMVCEAAPGAEPSPREGQQCAWFSPEEWGTLSFAPADAAFLAAHGEELAGLCRRSAAHRAPLPPWLKTSFQGGRERNEMRHLLRGAGLHTVCEGAKCPNRCECWRHRTATFMILGDTCTRACRFCSVNHGRPAPPEAGEPARVADSAAELGLRYVVVTCVTRDDLADGGAGAMAATVEAIRARLPEALTEVLCSDYNGDFAAVEQVLAARPAVFGHNLETVERLTPQVRSRAQYRRSLAVLRHAAEHAQAGTVVKSGLMLGLGESEEEVRQALKDLREAGVSIVTLGQYLQPTPAQLPVVRYVTPEEFARWARYAEAELGFCKAVAGPLVRSSYMAATAYFESRK